MRTIKKTGLSSSFTAALVLVCFFAMPAAAHYLSASGAVATIIFPVATLLLFLGKGLQLLVKRYPNKFTWSLMELLFHAASLIAWPAAFFSAWDVWGVDLEHSIFGLLAPPALILAFYGAFGSVERFKVSFGNADYPTRLCQRVVWVYAVVMILSIAADVWLFLNMD